MYMINFSCSNKRRDITSSIGKRESEERFAVTSKFDLYELCHLMYDMSVSRISGIRYH